MNNLTIKTLEVAKSQLGVHEATGHNDGPKVKMYLASVGLAEGNPWCMAFVYWCVGQAALFYKIRNPLTKTGGVMRQLETTLCKRTVVPAAGAIFILDFGKGLGHTGFVTSVVGDTIYTIEGNTNDDGSRDGIGVFARTRKASTVKAYILLA